MKHQNFLTALACIIFPLQIFAVEISGFDSTKPWLSSLPRKIQKNVLWYADHEEGTLYDWEYDDPDMSGGGIFNTGSEDEAFALAVSDYSFTGTYCAQATIMNAYRAMNGNKAVRLMRWTNKPWDMGGKEFPSKAYYSVWMMIPENYNPNKYPPFDTEDTGWWNVFQFKSKDADGVSQPVWTLDIMRDEDSQGMKFYFYSKYNNPQSFKVDAGDIPVGEWFHIEACYVRSGKMKKNGLIALWINGDEVFKAKRVITRLNESTIIWGIGNYTDHIDGGEVPGSATVYFDDAIVSKAPVNSFVKWYLK